MKSLVYGVAAAMALTVAGAAQASAELAQKAGCMTCHAVDSKKMGPSFKDVAKKFKGNAAAEGEVIAKLKGGKGHPPVKASDDDLKAVVKWVLAQ